MPHRFPFASHTNDDENEEMGPDQPKRLRPSSLLRKPLSLWRRPQVDTNDEALARTVPAELEHTYIPDYCARRPIPSSPRPQTFRRQESERREKLLEVEPTTKDRRALSEDTASDTPDPVSEESLPPTSTINPLPTLQTPDFNDERRFVHDHRLPQGDDIDKATLQEEYDRRWILNLSMHFRDMSNREKFFVTYAEKSTQWRRLTVSLDYRNAPEESLEADLSTLRYQRDKSLRIYEAIRDSLPDIQYYDTVTNLKLETTADDGQLHVHVREDANEIVNWPAISLFDHIQCPRFNESSLEFDSHLSGFVYKVRLHGRVVIKKEIPGPDTVDEFLYEVNALDSLLDSRHVVHLEGLVTDDRGELVKGLLISYATRGALVDMIYDFRGTTSLPWHRREKWAQQIVSGLADIHEAGFVQGDFTLSNIVIDEDDNAQIIDINRRGCPVGWESPELNKLIDSGQRISMSIGVKTDLFQLGMVLWALAEEVDEPERVERPLPAIIDEVPLYFHDIVETCLSDRPQRRKGAIHLLQRFPTTAGQLPSRRASNNNFAPNSPFSDGSLSSSSAHRSAKKYIDPDMAITIDDVKEGRMPDRREVQEYSSLLQDAVTYMHPDSNPASMYAFESEGSCVIGTRRRGRSPVSSRRRRSSPYGRTEASSATSYEPSPIRRRFSGYGNECDDTDAAHAYQYRREDSGWETLGAAGSRISPILKDSTCAAELLHMDSGFEEVMDPSLLQDPPTPGSYYTPGATPTDQDENSTVVAFEDGKEDNVIIDDIDEKKHIPVSRNGEAVLME